MYKIRMSYILIFLITLIFALLVGGPMPYFLFYIVILSFFIPLLHLLISFLGIKSSIKLPHNSLYKGDNIDIEYSIKNRNLFSIPILKFTSNINKKLGHKSSNIKTLSLAPRKDFKTIENIVLKRRGFYESVNLNIEISDIYSLFTLKKDFKTENSLLIYPSIIELDSFRVFSNRNLGEILVEKSIFEDKSDISTIDEYVQGDSINKIHWKVSAKRGTPMVKSFETVSDTSLNLFIDSNKNLFRNDYNHHIEDTMVDISAAIINYFLNLNIDITLNTLSHKKRIQIKGKNKDQLKTYLETLAKFKADGEYNIKSFVEDELYSFNNNSIIVIITAVLDREIGELAIKLKIKNLIPIFIIVSDLDHIKANIDKSIGKKLREDNIELFFIDYSSNIKEELELENG